MSCKDHGTLGHFRTLLSCCTATKEPKKNADACVDFLVTVFTGHILAKPEDNPPSGALPTGLHKATSELKSRTYLK